VPVRRISGAVIAYIAIAVAELAALLIISSASVSIAGVVLALCLFTFLFQGNRIAWWILLTLNSLGLARIAIGLGEDLVSGDHLLWSHVLILGLTALAMEAALLSPGMRHHIASRGLRVAPRQSA
jgi:hypothetical protein